MYTLYMKHVWLTILILIVCILLGGMIAFVVRLPALHTALSRSQASVHESGMNDPYVIPAGTYTLTEGAVTFTLTRPNDTTQAYTGTNPAYNGTITLTSDASGNLTGAGVINFNLTPLTFTSTSESNDDTLVALTGPHFFNTGTYPNATFSIMSITRTSTSTNTFTVATRFTLLGEGHDIIFPATFSMRDGALHVVTNFVFDRTQWGMTHASASLVGDNAVGAIDDMIATHLTLTLKP